MFRIAVKKALRKGSLLVCDVAFSEVRGTGADIIIALPLTRDMRKRIEFTADKCLP